MPERTIRIGTRGSALARWQTDHVADLLRAAYADLTVEVTVISTQGDRVLDQPLPLVGGKGLFTAELEAALHSGEIDCAVHSLKDLPTELGAGLIVGAIPQRADPADALVSRDGHTLATLPEGARIGTSSRRRAAQLLHTRPDLQMRDIRGNVDTRIRKALDPDGDYDAILLAFAGLDRLGKADAISERIGFDRLLPAPGQGALAIQCRDDGESRDLLALLTHVPTATAVTAERAFLGELGSGCSLPVAAYAEIEEGNLRLRGRVNSLDGAQQIDVALIAGADEAEAVGRELAQQALAQGAAQLLESLS